MIRAVGTPPAGRVRMALGLGAGTIACAVCLAAGASTAPAPAASLAPAGIEAHEHFACNLPKVACHFSTPSGNIRCLWTPTPNNVACERLATGRAYRLRPSGKAKRIKLALKRRGETLPTNQQVVFPDSLSCHDTRTTMTCNQDFGLGEFSFTANGSHSS
jgi:hypothetical protein